MTLPQPDLERTAPADGDGGTGAPRLDRVDAWIAAAVLTSAFLLGTWYLPVFRAAGGVPSFYQNEFGPAVMWACGKGFGNPDLGASPELRAFLETRTDTFSCAALPPGMTSGRRTVFQDGHSYLMLAAGTVWRIAGTAWASLDLLAGALFAVTLAAAYLALRFVCGRALSLLVTGLWAMSPLHLSNLPNLRDYSKAPFFVLMLVALGAAARERRPARLVALGAAFGAAEGFGFGMRTDVILNLAPFLLVVFAARPEGVFQSIPVKAASAAAAIALFIIVALPALRPYEKSGKLWHVVLLGLTTPFDGNLDIRPAPYEFGYKYLDGYIEAVVTTQAARTHPDAPPVTFAMFSYDPACGEYYRTLAGIFPGDLLTRMMGSALHVFSIPFLPSADHVPFGVTGPILMWIEQRRADLMLWFEGMGPLAVAALLFLIACRRLRYAVVASTLMLGWAVYPFIQFEGRHIFHLELLMLGTVACVGVLAWRAVAHLARREPVPEWRARAFRSLVFVGGLAAAVVVTLSAARAIQAPRAEALLASYRSAPVDPIATSATVLDDARVRLAGDLFKAPHYDYGAQAVMLAAAFDTDRCTGASLDVTFHYDNTEPGLDFSRTMTVPIARGAGSTIVFFPVYSLARRGATVSSFAGLDIPAAAAGCVGLSRVRDLDRAPLWLEATVTTAGPPARPYQRLNLAGALPPRVWGKLIRHWPGIAELG